MKNFEEFTNYVKENVGSMLPTDFANAKIDINQVTRNNGLVLIALTICAEGQNVSPTIYLESFYSQYEAGADIQDVLKSIVELYLDNIAAPKEFANIGTDFTNFDFIKERVIMVVVNEEKNTKLLSEIPYVKFEDLAIIFKVLIAKDDGSMATAIIRNEYLSLWNVTKEELYEFAKKNTQVLLPASVLYMTEFMIERMSGGILNRYTLRKLAADSTDGEALKNNIFSVLCEKGMSEETAERVLEDIIKSVENPMYVISNKQKINGAVSIFYEDVLSGLAEKFGTDLYILPSSVHECIAIPYDEEQLEELIQMVRVINATQLTIDEFLSDNVYHFNAETKTLKLA